MKLTDATRFFLVLAALSPSPALADLIIVSTACEYDDTGCHDKVPGACPAGNGGSCAEFFDGARTCACVDAEGQPMEECADGFSVSYESGEGDGIVSEPAPVAPEDWGLGTSNEEALFEADREEAPEEAEVLTIPPREVEVLTVLPKEVTEAVCAFVGRYPAWDKEDPSLANIFGPTSFDLLALVVGGGVFPDHYPVLPQGFIPNSQRTQGLRLDPHSLEKECRCLSVQDGWWLQIPELLPPPRVVK